MLSVCLRPASTHLRWFQLLISWIFEHVVTHRPSACPPTLSCSRPACRCMQTKLHILHSLCISITSIIIIGTRNKGHRCGPDEYKIGKARHSPPYPCSILHRDRLPVSVQVFQQWPLSYLPVNEGFTLDKCDTVHGSMCIWYASLNMPSNITNIPHCCTALNSCYFK